MTTVSTRVILGSSRHPCLSFLPCICSLGGGPNISSSNPFQTDSHLHTCCIECMPGSDSPLFFVGRLSSKCAFVAGMNIGGWCDPSTDNTHTHTHTHTHTPIISTDGLLSKTLSINTRVNFGPGLLAASW